MARKVSSLEEQLDRLAELRGQAPSPEGRAEAARWLNSKMNLVAAKAARIAGEWLAAELTPELVAAFDRFMVKPRPVTNAARPKSRFSRRSANWIIPIRLYFAGACSTSRWNLHGAAR